MKKILFSSGIVMFMAGSLALGGTGAFFSDIEASLGNTFAAGSIDLKIDNTSYYNGVFNQDTSWELRDLTVEKFFNFLDLKPGDFGEDTISIHVDTNDAYICADVTLTSNDDNGFTEPESLVDQTDGVGEGELAQNVNFIWWADDGDNVLEVGEEVISQGPIGNLTLGEPIKVALADSETNIWNNEPGPVPGEETVYIGKAWCFGTLSVQPEVQDGEGQVGTPGTEGSNGPDQRNAGFICDGSLLGNETQTDSLTADVTFSAIQARHNPDFVCKVPETFGSCENPQLAFADEVIDYDQGVRKDGTNINLDRTDPTKALGAPQSAGNPFDSPVPTGEFFSLGFDEGTDGTGAEGGWIVVGFEDNVIVDGPGNDLRIWEVTGGNSYPVEKVKIEVSQDGSTWFPVVSSVDRDAEADLADSGLAWAKYVRITDVSNRAEFEDAADGYDLDAFSALNCGVREN